MIVGKEEEKQQSLIGGEQVLAAIKEVKEQVVKVLEEGSLLKVDLKKIIHLPGEEEKYASSSFLLQNL